MPLPNWRGFYFCYQTLMGSSLRRTVDSGNDTFGGKLVGPITRAFGYDSKKLWWYRDIALGTVASIATLWAVVALGFQKSSFDTKLGFLCIVVAAVCCLVSSNRLVLIMMVFGVVSIQSWFAVIFSLDLRGLAIAIVASLVELILLARFRNRPVHQR